MHVVATAGHVDHGKSTLVRALTGRDPDRYAEEKRRGLTIDLGFAWTDLPGAGPVAFVDVPGHERFVPTMLAGVGPVPVAVFVVAADGGWMPQSAEHLAALDALGVRHGVLVVTRADLADPAPARERALAELRTSSLGEVPAVACSAVSGAGLEDVRRVLAGVLAAVPAPDPAAPVRFWVDRSFTVTGAGTVVTGTLSAGSLAVGDELELGDARVHVHVRGLQSLERAAERVEAVARVAVNLRGTDRHDVGRGDALLTPGTHRRSDVLDVRLPRAGHGSEATDATDVPTHVVAHLGSAAVPVRVRPLGRDGDDVLLRLQLATPLPLRVGDRLLLRDPAQHTVLGAGTALDVDPPPLRRRGAATARVADLAGVVGPDFPRELRRRRLLSGRHLRTTGVTPTGRPVAGDWYADPGFWADRGRELRRVVAGFAAANPLQPGPTLEQTRRLLGLPALELVEALVAPPLRVHDGRVVERTSDLPPAVERAVDLVLADLRRDPFAAPDVERLRELRLGRAELAAAVRAGRLERVAEGLVLAPGYRDRAVQALSGAPQPFSVSEARRALGTSRRVAVPLLEALDAAGATARDGDDRRRLTGR
ncbi:selenocysteine-specific elongation factor [Kineococcus radiotolerans]|uniref:Selenocysteine-specific elongation factor n=1 Tax=Kineococcus radiotolerans TaxID=131568 RepID=A0A7W4TK05_KINRA|nr:selenocysteine-specific translation elongation factor [Kineococcus radiotolerans]MBB2899696.1 selenocysteine-specific elongation factor [Kineococcus radiotolerans]